MVNMMLNSGNILGGSIVMGGSLKWMVYHGKSPSKMDDLEVPPF